MSVHGYKVNNAELQRALTNLTSRQINVLAKAGEKALDDISRNTIEMFYKSTGSSHNYSSLMYSLKVKRNAPRQDSKFVWVDIDMYIDTSSFLYATEDFYAIYDWADRPSNDSKRNKRMTHSQAAEFVIGLQWNQGVIGLPSPYAHLQTSPLNALLEDEIKRIWNRKVKQFL